MGRTSADGALVSAVTVRRIATYPTCSAMSDEDLRCSLLASTRTPSTIHPRASRNHCSATRPAIRRPSARIGAAPKRQLLPLMTQVCPDSGASMPWRRTFRPASRSVSPSFTESGPESAELERRTPPRRRRAGRWRAPNTSWQPVPNSVGLQPLRQAVEVQVLVPRHRKDERAVLIELTGEPERLDEFLLRSVEGHKVHRAPAMLVMERKTKRHDLIVMVVTVSSTVRPFGQVPVHVPRSQPGFPLRGAVATVAAGAVPPAVASGATRSRQRSASERSKWSVLFLPPRRCVSSRKSDSSASGRNRSFVFLPS